MSCRIKDSLKFKDGSSVSRHVAVLAQVIIMCLAAVAALGAMTSLRLTEVASALPW